jgi:hypothetical protein
VLLIISVFFWLHCLLPLSEDHAIYISVLEIVEKEARTELRVKVFTDDLANAIKNSFEDDVVMIDDFPSENEALIEAYFKVHLILMSSSSELEYYFIEYKTVGDSYWFTFEVLGSIGQLYSIKADYFMELFPTQQNIVTLFDISGEKKFCRLTIDNDTCEML